MASTSELTSVADDEAVVHIDGAARVYGDLSPGTDYAYIGLNLKDPLLRRIEVRKAIGYAIDRDAIVKYLSE